MIVVVSFPGSNCDRDVAMVCRDVLGLPTRQVWYAERGLPSGTHAVILPGGFSFGDYLRPGAIAARTDIMSNVAAFAARGGPVLGICNGFQMLLEAHMLPGSLTRNAELAFRCRQQTLRVTSSRPWLSSRFSHDTLLKMPIAHSRGRYTIAPDALHDLRAHDQILLRYAAQESPNGSVDDIAAICDRTGRIVGMMPHPERASDQALGSVDGARWLGAWLESSS